ncbi:hypothetical protein ACJX0J_009343, partial [Zea mays]
KAFEEKPMPTPQPRTDHNNPHLHNLHMSKHILAPNQKISMNNFESDFTIVPMGLTAYIYLFDIDNTSSSIIIKEKHIFHVENGLMMHHFILDGVIEHLYSLDMNNLVLGLDRRMARSLNTSTRIFHVDHII